MSVQPRFARRMVGALCALTLAVGLSACSSDDDGDKTEETVDPNKPAAVEFSIPKGFTEVDAYEPMVPLTSKFEARGFQLEGVETEEMVFVVSYVMEFDTNSMDPAELQGLVEGYVNKVGNEADGEIYLSLSNGRSGFHKYIRHPDATGEDIIRYDAEYFFDGNKLVQVGCQMKAQDLQEKVQEGCVTILDTLKF